MIGGFKEGETKEIELNIEQDILEICLKYLHYKVSLTPFIIMITL